MTETSPPAHIAVPFVDMAHQIVWSVVGTTNTAGKPSTRVLHPIWEWNGNDLTGWIATAPQSLKASHLAETPHMSITYWAPNHDTCTADCAVEWLDSAEEKRAGWERFVSAPEPVGYDPSMIPGWDSHESEAFGILRLTPHSLRVMPGSMLLAGEGELLTWSR